MSAKKPPETDRSKLPEPSLPKCPSCGKNPFECKCGTWEDLNK